MNQNLNKPVTSPQIHVFTDYRAFLLEFYRHRKSLRSGFSYRQFAALSKIKSPNYLQLVMLGERNLSEETAGKVASAMRLDAGEKAYFLALIRHANAKTDEEVHSAKRQGLVALKKILTKTMTLRSESLLDHWTYLLVRELAFLPAFEASAEYVVKTLKGALSLKEADAALKFLIQAGHIERKGRSWIVKDEVLDTGDDIFRHTKMQTYHAELLRYWSQNLTKMSAAHQELGLLNIPIDSTKIPELKKRIRQFQDEVIGWLQEEKQPDCVVQLGCYLMPVTEIES